MWAIDLGVDLVPTPEGLTCIEVNLQPGITPAARKRRFIRSMRPAALVRFAREHGFDRLVWLSSNRLPVPDFVVDDVGSKAREAGIVMEFRDGPCMVHGRWPIPDPMPTRWALGDHFPERTLIFRRNEYFTGLDRLLTDKGLFLRALADELERSGETRVRAFPMTREPGPMPDTPPNLPNLVYKYPDDFAGLGVFFMRARDEEHAVEMARELDRRRGEPPGLFQPFLHPGARAGDRAWDYRSEVIVSPLGSLHTISITRTAGATVPHEVPYGLVPRGLFTANISGGGVSELVGPEHSAEVAEASLAVGEAVRRLLARTYVTTSG
jgi:hypothetical protein